MFSEYSLNVPCVQAMLLNVGKDVATIHKAVVDMREEMLHCKHIIPDMKVGTGVCFRFMLVLTFVSRVFAFFFMVVCFRFILMVAFLLLLFAFVSH
jgi:hypothetical protein